MFGQIHPSVKTAHFLDIVLRVALTDKVKVTKFNQVFIYFFLGGGAHWPSG